MAFSYYGTLVEASTYFDERLHSLPWLDSAATDRPKALNQARQLIDNLNYKGVKADVYDIMYDGDGVLLATQPTRAAIIAADATQPLEFPRGASSSIPEQIKQAQWEIAILLLDGADPDGEYDTIRVKRQGYSLARSTYADDDASVEHLMYGILSPTAWRLLKPFVLFDGSIRISRVD